MVVEVRDDLHGEIRKLALLNDLRIYGLTNKLRICNPAALSRLNGLTPASAKA